MYLDTLKLFYEESKAARGQLEGLVERYRANTSTVLAIATAAVAFFGFSDGPRQPLLYWTAIAAYIAAAVLALWIYAPMPSKVNVAYNTADVLADSDGWGPLTPLQIYYDYARGHQDACRTALTNVTRSGGLAQRFRMLIVAVAVLVVAASGSVMFGKSEPTAPTRVIVEQGEK